MSERQLTGGTVNFKKRPFGLMAFVGGNEFVFDDTLGSPHSAKLKFGVDEVVELQPMDPSKTEPSGTGTGTKGSSGTGNVQSHRDEESMSMSADDIHATAHGLLDDIMGDVDLYEEEVTVTIEPEDQNNAPRAAVEPVEEESDSVDLVVRETFENAVATTPNMVPDSWMEKKEESNRKYLEMEQVPEHSETSKSPSPFSPENTEMKETQDMDPEDVVNGNVEHSDSDDHLDDVHDLISAALDAAGDDGFSSDPDSPSEQDITAALNLTENVNEEGSQKKVNETKTKGVQQTAPALLMPQDHHHTDASASMTIEPSVIW